MQEGIDLCKKNALVFLKDAKLVIKYERLCHALVSVEFAIEEIGKIVMLQEALKNSNQDPVPVEEKVFRSHKDKSDNAWTVLDPKFKVVFEGDFDGEAFEWKDFLTDTKASHKTRLECAFVDFDESRKIWHLGRDMDESRLIALIKHIEARLPQI